MIYCPACARLKDRPEPWCIACGRILDPDFPESELPPEVAGSLEITRELAGFKVFQSLANWAGFGIFLLCGIFSALLVWSVERLFPTFADSTLGTILLVGTFLPVSLPAVVLFALRSRMKAWFPPTQVRLGLNERGVLVYHVVDASGLRRFKINLAVIEKTYSFASRGHVSLQAKRLGRWEPLMPMQEFGGSLPPKSLRVCEIVEALRAAGPLPVPPELLEASPVPAPLLRPKRSRWKLACGARQHEHQRVPRHWRRPAPGRSIPIELMGTLRAGRFVGQLLGGGGLVPEPNGLRICFLMGMHPPIWIPAERLTSISRYISIPFLSWGLCIRHTLPGLQSPLYFNSFRRPKQALQALEGYPWASKEWKRL